MPDNRHRLRYLLPPRSGGQLFIWHLQCLRHTIHPSGTTIPSELYGGRKGVSRHFHLFNMQLINYVLYDCYNEWDAGDRGPGSCFHRLSIIAHPIPKHCARWDQVTLRS